jgi:hypothetical protein
LDDIGDLEILNRKKLSKKSLKNFSAKYNGKQLMNPTESERRWRAP